MADVWYRYQDIMSTENAYPYVEEYRVIRETEKSVYITTWMGEKRVLKKARVRYAYPTQELALDSYIQRKKKQAQYARNTLAHAEAMLYQAEAIQRGEQPKRPTGFTFQWPS